MLGCVEFSNPNTNISKNVYYAQSVDKCWVEQKSHFELAKMPKMNTVKYIRSST